MVAPGMRTRPLIVDLFCCGGGAAVGYHRAGFDVIGVDLVMQHEFPFEFAQGNALTFPIPDHAVAIHASPPCKAHTAMRTFAGGTPPRLFDPHVDLIASTRARLLEVGLPYIIENVVGAPLEDPTVLCGSMFALGVRRHRLFETSFPLEAPACDHPGQGAVVGVYGYGGAWDSGARPGGGGGRKVCGPEAAAAMGIIHTTTQALLAQAIPPAYTEHIGRQLIAQLG
jgi:DNA (cytosine-5)-methyltransferase 1